VLGPGHVLLAGHVHPARIRRSGDPDVRLARRDRTDVVARPESGSERAAEIEHRDFLVAPDRDERELAVRRGHRLKRTLGRLRGDQRAQQRVRLAADGAGHVDHVGPGPKIGDQQVLAVRGQRDAARPVSPRQLDPAGHVLAGRGVVHDGDVGAEGDQVPVPVRGDRDAERQSGNLGHPGADAVQSRRAGDHVVAQRREPAGRGGSGLRGLETGPARPDEHRRDGG
jgi:hypothetical protein